MTVCIAAICDQSVLVGAADRMLTSGDIEFEPDFESIPKLELPKGLDQTYTPNGKIIPLTTSIAVMTAGDAGLQMEIVEDILSAMTERAISQDPSKWWTVKETVSLYLHFYDKAKAARAQTTVFAPFGLTSETFFSKQHEMSKDFIDEVAGQIRRFEANFRAEHGVETIILGIDSGKEPAMPHIYSIFRSLSGDAVTCCDSIGFAAVGSGMRHAESQFMLAGHSRHSSMPDTLLLTYLAKKRSEVAPGVGEGTDMFVIGPGRGIFAMLDRIKDFNYGKIDEIYQKAIAAEGKALTSAREEMTNHIKELFNQRATQQQKEEDEAERKLAESMPGFVNYGKMAENKEQEPPVK